MRNLPWASAVLAAIFVVFASLVSQAADAWVEIKSPNFVVLSNSNERRARDVAWQFEQIRAALLAGWPWARARLDRPVYVIAVKDEATMKAIAPQFWEQRGSIRPDSVFVTAADRHYIALRADVTGDGQVNVNPYFSSYWTFSSLALNAAFEKELPLWLRNGLAGVLANSIVRQDELRFGHSVPWYHRTIVQEGRLRLSELLAMERSSPYYTNRATRELFDAQSWGLVHYMLFGNPNDKIDRLNVIVKLVIEGTPSVAAVTQVYGNVEALENGYIGYLKKELFPYSRMKAETRIQARDFAVRMVGDAEAAAGRAGFHAAMGRPVEARALVAEARKSPAPPVASFEVEAALLDRDGKSDDAFAALVNAEKMGSANFYAHFQLAGLTLRGTPDTAAFAAAEKRLRRAVELNDAHAPSLIFLANVLAQQRQGQPAIEFATKAVKLEPQDPDGRLALARALWAASRPSDAIGHARAALLLSQTQQERERAQELIDFLTKTPPR